MRQLQVAQAHKTTGDDHTQAGAPCQGQGLAQGGARPVVLPCSSLCMAQPNGAPRSVSGAGVGAPAQSKGFVVSSPNGAECSSDHDRTQSVRLRPAN